jgi:DNA-binding XRE family transcriptional regulator
MAFLSLEILKSKVPILQEIRSSTILPKTSPKVTDLARRLEVTQAELLEIFVLRFEGALLNLIAIEQGAKARPRAVRQWIKNNTSTPRRQISHAIKVTRHRHRITQQQLADRLGWPRWMIANIENCRRYCHPGKARQVAAALGDSDLRQLLDHYGW